MEREVHAGGLVFLPRNMTIQLESIGSEPIALVFIFSAPGFEDYMRCRSGAHHDHQKGIATLRACWSCDIRGVATAAE